MESSLFHKLSDETLDRILVKCENEAGDHLDAEMENGGLSLVLEDGRQFLITKNAPMRQLWLASPLSGASHFVHDNESGEWVSTRQEGVTLLGRLSEEISEVTGQKILF